MSFKVGIDFGTSNSAIGSIAHQPNDNHLFRVGPHNKTTIPSWIAMRDDGEVVIGEQALDFAQQNDPRFNSVHFIPSIKQGLPVPEYEGNLLTSLKRVNGNFPKKFFPVEELAGSLIRELSIAAENKVNQPISEALIGRPVHFSNNIENDRLAEQRLREAASYAGIQNVDFLYEPVAAAINYKRNAQSDPKGLGLIFDFGGGTLDTAIIDFDKNEQSYRKGDGVVAAHGINLGGTDIDKAIFRSKLQPRYFGENHEAGANTVPYILWQDLLEWHLLDITSRHIRGLKDIRMNSDKSDYTYRQQVANLITIISKNEVPNILRAVETAKIDLANSNTSEIEFITENTEFQAEPVLIDELLTQIDIHRATHEHQKQIEECLDETLRQAGINEREINTIVPTGGSSLNHFVIDLLSRRFQNQLNFENNGSMITSVASGLAIATEI